MYLTRDTDRTMQLNDRPKYANNVKADYFLSLHRNSYNSSSTGIEGWIYSKANSDTQNKAQAILGRIISVANVTNRGIKKGFTGKPTSDYAVNRYSNMPSMLLELLFISNPSDNVIYDKHINDYAIAICKGFCDMFGVKYIEKSTPQTDILYKVQVGAYKEKANAEKLLNELKNKGFNGYIINN